MKYIYYVLGLIMRQRRSGTTTLIQKIAAENDCYIVCRYADDVKKQFPDLQDKCITLEQLFNCEGLPLKPILFETPAIKHLCELAKERYEQVSEQNFRRDKALDKIKKVLTDLEQSGEKVGSVIQREI